MPVGKAQDATLAGRAIVLADASKLGHNAFARIAPLEAIEMLVTDAPPPVDVRQALSAASSEVILAPA